MYTMFDDLSINKLLNWTDYVYPWKFETKLSVQYSDVKFDLNNKNNGKLGKTVLYCVERAP